MIKVWDWVRYVDDEGRVFKVLGMRSGIMEVIVREPKRKRKRKITLSKALAWMQHMVDPKTSKALVLSGWGGGDRWAVTPDGSERIIGYGMTPLKALIAARKALGVKS
jgi:hypothetical protein